MNLQAIYQSKNGPDGKWLDFCREQPASIEQAKDRLAGISREMPFPMRVYVEDWDHKLPTLEHDGSQQYPRRAVAAFGDWGA